MLATSDVIDAITRACARAGFGLIQPLQVGWYNERVEGSLRLEDFGSAAHLALVVGNTRALWPALLGALARDPELAASTDPLDAYTERTLAAAVAPLGVTARVRFAHAAGEGAVAIQRLAHAAGLAYLTETHLCVHPTYGPWIGLRAAVSVAVAGPPGPAPVLADPCGGCERGCRGAFERALSTLDGPPSAARVRAHAPEWIAHRDACPIGREHRYSEPQLLYHYTHDPELLRLQRLSRSALT